MGLSAAAGADSVKIGFVTTLTTPAGVIGQDMVDAVNLALEDIGGKMAGLDVELIVEDDGFKPDVGKQSTDKLVKQDDVDFVAARGDLADPQPERAVRCGSRLGDGRDLGLTLEPLGEILLPRAGRPYLTVTGFRASR